MIETSVIQGPEGSSLEEFLRTADAIKRLANQEPPQEVLERMQPDVTYTQEITVRPSDLFAGYRQDTDDGTTPLGGESCTVEEALEIPFGFPMFPNPEPGRAGTVNYRYVKGFERTDFSSSGSDLQQDAERELAAQTAMIVPNGAKYREISFVHGTEWIERSGGRREHDIHSDTLKVAYFDDYREGRVLVRTDVYSAVSDSGTFVKLEPAEVD